MFHTEKLRIGASFACCLAAVAVTMAPVRTANAWFERTIISRALQPNGCLLQVSGLGHGDQPSDPVNVFNQATFRGMTINGNGNCNSDLPSNSNPLLFAEFYNYLVVQISDSPTQDTYFYCTEWWSGALSGTTTVTKDYSFASAPCGPGWYALVSCMFNVGAFTTSPWSEGYFSPTSLSQCNVSLDWHPVGLGSSTPSRGPRVNL